MINFKQMKGDEDQGRYLHPELFRQPAEKRVGYEKAERLRRNAAKH